ncbi:uncharacterized protein CMU_004610, partial [Cryptosporidium muris RN66]
MDQLTQTSNYDTKPMETSVNNYLDKDIPMTLENNKNINYNSSSSTNINDDNGSCNKVVPNNLPSNFRGYLHNSVNNIHSNNYYTFNTIYRTNSNINSGAPATRRSTRARKGVVSYVELEAEFDEFLESSSDEEKPVTKKRGRGRPRINRDAIIASTVPPREPSSRRKGAAMGSLIAAETKLNAG